MQRFCNADFNQPAKGRLLLRFDVITLFYRDIKIMANLGYIVPAPGYIRSSQSDYLQSQNGAYFATLQDDGNLCIYNGTPTRPGAAVWCASCNQPCNGIFYAAVQSDGNFRAFIGTPDHTIGSSYWGSSNGSSPPSCFLILENDADLNMYMGTPSEPGALLWSSSPNAQEADLNTVSGLSAPSISGS